MLLYTIKLSISLSIVYLFYQLFLRRLTFYNWNRWYLLIYSMVCFVIPCINVFTLIIGQPALRESALVNYIPAITPITPIPTSVGINWWLVTAVVFISGILIMTMRLGLQYYSLYKMRSKAVLLYDNKVKLYHIDAPVMPFSFGRGIYVNKHQHSEHELKEIIRHEFIHVKQRHSLDIIWSELLVIMNWYNPFAWLLRHDIRQNLEFIADQQVLQTGLDRKQYQYLLLKVIGVNSFSIANNFNFSSLKKRIAMMNKNQSARVHLIRFLFLLPLLVVVLLAFRNSTQTNRQPERPLVTDTIPDGEKTPPGWKDLENIDVNINDGKVTVTLKNKKVETYDLSNLKERKAFETKYGPVPVAPPPPPPPALNNGDLPVTPKAPEKPEVREAPEKPEAPEKVEIAEAPETPEAVAIAPVPPPPPPAFVQDCYNQKGFCVNVVDNRGEATVIVKDKDNKIVLAISLTDWNKDKKQYEEKYGEVSIHQIRLLPKTVMGYKKDHVSINPATIVKDDEVVAVDKPIGEVVVKNSPKMMEGQNRKVVVTPSNGYMLIANGRPVVKRATQHQIVTLFEAKPATLAKAGKLNELVFVGKPAKAAFSDHVTLANLTKVEPQQVIILDLKPTFEAKTSANTKEAAEARPQAEAKTKPAEQPKPAAPTKEQ